MREARNKEERTAGGEKNEERRMIGERSEDETKTIGEKSKEEKKTIGETSEDNKKPIGESSEDENKTSEERSKDEKKTIGVMAFIVLLELVCLGLWCCRGKSGRLVVALLQPIPGVRMRSEEIARLI
ncbi:hypothetical protein NDU88_005578 [Pleurodeles waltl]|uniref:Uncharacterized protein n=1 Tax=Pleurodeles waltl TaxID=8319 RepID=A0AAV7RPE4_PLEWA|nr:hypothetical protein NDU88_005578 [Pleurodeles waltl]